MGSKRNRAGVRVRFAAPVSAALTATATALLLVVPPAAPLAAAASQPPVGLAWQVGQKATLVAGPHQNNVHACNSTAPCNSLDFAPLDGLTRAAASGTAYRPCKNLVVIDHGNGWYTGYYHLNNIGNYLTDGQRVTVGDPLGQISTMVGCGGTGGSQNHVHWSLKFFADGSHGKLTSAQWYSSSGDVDLQGVVLAGWVVTKSPPGPFGCMTFTSTNEKQCDGGVVTNYIGSGGSADVYAIKTTNTHSGMVEVHVIGSPLFSGFFQHAATPIASSEALNFKWRAADFNQDGSADVYGIKTRNTASGMVEVHVIGSPLFSGFFQHAVTPIPTADAADYQWLVGDYNQDGSADVYAIKTQNTASGMVEVHVIGSPLFSGFFQHAVTPIPTSDAANYQWSVGDYNQDGSADIYAIKTKNTASGSVEVHVIGSPWFSGFFQHAVTPIPTSEAANFKWNVGDHNRDGSADIYAIKTHNTGSGSVEVHVIGSPLFSGYLRQAVTPIPSSARVNFQWQVAQYDR